MKLILVKKKNNVPLETFESIDNVVQIDFCNMQQLGDDISDTSWNFLSIVTKENNVLKKQIVKLEYVWQFSLVVNKG